MLSDKILNTARELRSHAAQGLAAPPAMLNILADRLGDLGAQAITMEDKPVPPGARVPTLTVIPGGAVA